MSFIIFIQVGYEITLAKLRTESFTLHFCCSDWDFAWPVDMIWKTPAVRNCCCYSDPW